MIVDDKSRYTDWSTRDDIKANLQVDLILLLDEFDYPPVTIDDVYKEVLEQAENFKKYMMCKFPRFMLRTTYSSAHISQANFVFVPRMDFTQAWNDETLYKHFELSDDEIQLIEDTMRQMDN